MQAGLLNEIIEVYKPITETNSFGEVVQTLGKVCTTKARVIHASGNKAVENNEIVSNYTKTLHVRSYIPITDVSQVKYRDKMYRVTSVEDVRQGNYKEVLIEKINV